MIDNPLVSVVVLTYNSSKTVIETLNSIAAQTYRNLELIVTDDCSKDNTNKIVREWINKNETRFWQVKFLTVEKNTGVSANWNRGFDSCNGEYWKGIAGDDFLEPECIQRYVNYVNANPEALTVFSKVKIFGDKNDVKSIADPFLYDFFSLSIKEQLTHLINRSNCIPAPSLFLNLSKIRELGIRADERIPMLEDYPMWINMLSKGIKFHFIDEYLVRYRVGGSSLSTGSNVNLMLDSRRLFELFYLIPNRFAGRLDESVYYIFETEQIMIQKVLNTYEYKVGRFIVKPLRKIKNIIINSLCRRKS